MKFYSLAGLLPFVVAEQTAVKRADEADAQAEPRGPRANSDVPAGTLNHVVPMTDALRKLYVDEHNKWRNDAAGGELADRSGATVTAKYLPKLTYDMDLERNSEEYAKLCNWDHSKPAGFTTLPYSIGENLYVTSAHTSSSQHEQSLHGWSIEHLDYSYSADDCNPGKMCGHYTQVVDKRSTRVGCAMVDCASMVNIGSVFGSSGGTYVICQYYGPGNYWGTTSFDYGATGSECPNGMDSEYPNLCATVGEDPCDLPDSGANRCLPGGTCSASAHLINGLAADFECSCTGNFQGRWCEGTSCTDVEHHQGKKLNGYSGIYFLDGSNQPQANLNGGGIFIFQGHEKDAAANWCASNADNDFACKSITKTDFGGGYYFWVPNKLAPADMPVVDDPSGQGETWARDCSAPAEPTPVASEPTPVASEPTPVASEPTPVESEPTPVESEPTPVESEPTPAPVEEEDKEDVEESEDKELELKLISKDGLLRVGQDCVAAKGSVPVVKACDPKDKTQQWESNKNAICSKGTNNCLEFTAKNKNGKEIPKLTVKKGVKKVGSKNKFNFNNGILAPKDSEEFVLMWQPKGKGTEKVVAQKLKQVATFGTVEN